MSNINTVAISGNLTRDPEMASLPSGDSVIELGIAVNKRIKQNEEWVDKTSFFDAKVYGGYAELLAKKLVKGSAVTVQGELVQERWETQDGNRSKVVIVARQVDGPDTYKPASESAPAAAVTPGESQGADGIPF